MDDMDSHEQPRYTTRRMHYEIEQAIARERARCAEIADDAERSWRMLDIKMACKGIAEKIREAK